MNQVVKSVVSDADRALFRNRLPIQVRFSDVDIMGHVSNTVYQTYYDAGKMSYFEAVLPQLDFKSVGIVGASVSIEYLLPIFMKTRILVETRVSVIGTKSLTFEHLLVNEHTGEILSTCKAVLVCFSITEQKSIPVPEAWRKSILAYDLGVTEK